MTTIGKAAVAWARLQVGKPYVFGAAGPDAFDCSGLVIAGYAAAGITALGHNTVLLRESTTLLPHEGDLEPGDLVFYYGTAGKGYADPEHVAIFLGRYRKRSLRKFWWVVQATDPAHGVEIVHMRHYARPTSYGRVHGSLRAAA